MTYPHYHDTTDQQGPALDIYDVKATAQEKVIMGYFKKHFGRYFAAHEVWGECFDNSVPLTSVRRALTTLTNHKKLIRLKKIKIPGIYKREVTVWTIPMVGKQSKLFQ